MNLSPEAKAILRKALLRGCEAVAPASLPMETLREVASNAGFPQLDAGELGKEVHYLVGKGWLEAVKNQFSAGQQRWRITAEGTDAIEGMG